jgi:DNA helicase IV
MPTDLIEPHPDLAHERAVLRRAYACLAAMRDRTAAAVAVTDNAAQEVDAAIASAHLRHRLRSLSPDVPGLSFGRLDDEAGDSWYVGRRHVEDDRGDPVVVDWRAPVSTPFYRATAADPLGLRRRRRFLMTGTELDDLFDEVFDDPDSVHAAHTHMGGIPDPLLAELERSRTGAMRDIVATIAAEQDVVIRAPLDTCLVVQGGPGTGKTAVGLHRAAFLLYEHRELLDRDGVLVVGPNPVFLRYIAQVLPSLGEAATRQTTIERLVSGSALRVRAVDTPERARLLGDPRLAEVLAAALRATLRRPTDDIVVATDWGRFTLSAATVSTAIDEILERGVPFTTGRTALRTRLHRLAWQQHHAARGDGAAPADVFDRALRSSSDLQTAIGRIWPTTSGAALAKRVLTNRNALAAAADGVLSREEQRLLLRHGARRLDDEPWSLAELVLVDEAEALVTGTPRAYGHVVVDEAQDLSPMELRALARRCPSRSMTVLGDLAQATAPAATSSWAEAIAHLGSPSNASVEELGLGYRVPEAIIEVANRLLPRVAPQVQPAGSVRRAGADPARVPAAPEALGAAVAGTVAALAGRWTSVGVIAPDAVRADVHDGLVAEGVPFAEGIATALEQPVTLLPPPDAKGLEFDAVVVVEPARFFADADDTSGGRLLYIALTRAVQELAMVHAEPLPAELTPF